MKLGRHTKTDTGRIRKERSDALIGTLAKEYPTLKGINPRMKLGTLESRLGVDSLSKAIKKLKSQ